MLLKLLVILSALPMMGFVEENMMICILFKLEKSVWQYFPKNWHFWNDARHVKMMPILGMIETVPNEFQIAAMI